MRKVKKNSFTERTHFSLPLFFLCPTLFQSSSLFIFIVLSTPFSRNSFLSHLLAIPGEIGLVFQERTRPYMRVSRSVRTDVRASLGCTRAPALDALRAGSSSTMTRVSFACKHATTRERPFYPIAFPHVSRVTLSHR